VTPICDIFDTHITLTGAEFKEVGFDVYWNKRPHVIVQDDERTISYEDLITQYPDFNGKYNDRPLMMEFAKNVDTDINIKYRYWVAQQIGRENGTIDEDIYNRLIRL
jgi:hypothetical protein